MKRSFEQVMAKLLKNEPRTARKYWREQLELLQKNWQPIHVSNMEKGVVRLQRGDGSYDELNLLTLRAEMPIEHYIVVRTLLRLLDEQARVAHGAVEVAKEATAMQIRRKRGGIKTAKDRSAEAKNRIKKLQAEEAKLRKMDPTMKKEAVAATLADRGLGRKGVIEKQLRGASKKSLEGR